MAQESGISWTDATFNPWWGCWPVSPGCALCYADREASRHGYSDLWQKTGPRRTFGDAHWNEPLRWARNMPRKLGRRPRVFCASMADIGEDHPVAAEQRPRLFDLVERTPELDWLLLTKRVATARQWLPQRWLREGFPRNVWMGFSAEDQQRYDERVRPALDLGAHVTFCSYEPALGPINFRLDENFLDWVIGGGESSNPASRARPMHPGWMRSARDQCSASGVAFHFKQWGEWGMAGSRPAGTPGAFATVSADGGVFKMDAYPRAFASFGAAVMELVGRKRAGRMLDGRTWDDFPVLRS